MFFSSPKLFSLPNSKRMLSLLHFTAGLTTLGKPQKHKDDDLDVDTGFEIARKCPKVLNDATEAQRISTNPLVTM